MWASRQFPAINATTRIGYLDVIEALLQGMSLVSILFSLINRRKTLWKRVFVDVKLVVRFRIWIASDTLIICTASCVL